MSRWSVGRWPAIAWIRTSFHGGPSSPRSNAFRFVPRTPGCWHSWVQVFPVPLEKSCGCRWVSCNCSFFWQLQSQRYWHWWWHSAADKRFPVVIRQHCGCFIQTTKQCMQRASHTVRRANSTCVDLSYNLYFYLPVNVSFRTEVMFAGIYFFIFFVANSPCYVCRSPLNFAPWSEVCSIL